jgi:hypothetical protein
VQSPTPFPGSDNQEDKVTDHHHFRWLRGLRRRNTRPRPDKPITVRLFEYLALRSIARWLEDHFGDPWDW